MSKRIETLVQLCLEQPFCVEKIQKHITENKMDSEAVTRAAIRLCDEALGAYADFVYINSREPQPQELITYNWETLFDVLLTNGLDSNLVICDDGKECDNIILALENLDVDGLNARIARNILSHGGTPNIPIENDTTVFQEIDGDLVIDINLGLYPRKWMLDRAVKFWMVLVGFGGRIVDGRSPVEMQSGYSHEILKDFEKFDYKILYEGRREFDMHIIDKESGDVVAIL